MGMLELQGVGFSLGSLRSGGATARFAASQNVAAIKFQGRWAAVRSLESYLQEAVCSLVAAELPNPRPTLAFAALSEDFASPPSRPWGEIFHRKFRSGATGTVQVEVFRHGNPALGLPLEEFEQRLKQLN